MTGPLPPSADNDSWQDITSQYYRAVTSSKAQSAWASASHALDAEDVAASTGSSSLSEQKLDEYMRRYLAKERRERAPLDAQRLKKIAQALRDSSREQDLKRAIADRESKIVEQAQELERKQSALQQALQQKSASEAAGEEFKQQARAFAEETESLRQELAGIQKEREIAYLIGRVCSRAGDQLLADSNIKRQFQNTEACDAFVLSIDIRRSTELMLRRRTPKGFANFLNDLCLCLSQAVKNHFGVIDKFTGDGLLAYFPVFFTGTDAGFHALSAAEESHRIFQDVYARHREAFVVVLKDVGLGAGIDFGTVHLVKVTNELTAIGTPVVYACRLAGAPAGFTYLNQPALGELQSKKGLPLSVTEAELELKNDGTITCYSARLATNEYKPAPPDWLVADSEPASQG